MKTKTLLAIVASLAILLAACGDSSSSGSSDADPALVAAIAGEIQGSSDGFNISDADATCIAEKTVSGVGSDRMTELGVTAENPGAIEDIDFTGDEIGKIVDGFNDCVDLQQLMADSLVADGSITDDDADCVAENFNGDLIKTLLTSTFSGEDIDDGPVGEELFQAVLDIFAECDISF
jgi:hypothetical protein